MTQYDKSDRSSALMFSRIRIAEDHMLAAAWKRKWKESHEDKYFKECQSILTFQNM